MEEAGLMTYTAASQQGAIKMFWLHFWELSGCPSFLRSMLIPKPTPPTKATSTSQSETEQVR